MENELIRLLQYHQDRIKKFSELYERCRLPNNRKRVAGLMDYHLTRETNLLRTLNSKRPGYSL